MPGGVLDREVPFRVRRLERLIFRRQLRLLDRQKQHADRDEHDGRHDHKQRLIVHAPARGLDGLEPRLRIEHRRDGQVQNAAHRAHQIDDRVALRAQRLRRHVRHQRHRWRPIRPHRDEKQTQHNDERDGLRRARRGVVAVFDQRQQIHQDHRAARAKQDERHPLADLRVRPVGQRPEERQQKQCENVVRRHDEARDRLVHVERPRQDQRDDVVVHLPERADGEERQTDEDGAPVVELHTASPFSNSVKNARMF